LITVELGFALVALADVVAILLARIAEARAEAGGEQDQGDDSE
jgi:hypothetical protein